MDDIVLFKQLTISDMSSIVDKILTELNIRLMAQRISINVSDEAKAWLGEEAYEPQFGARPLKRFVQRQIETPLASKMIRENLPEGTTIDIDLSEDGLRFTETNRNRLVSIIGFNKRCRNLNFTLVSTF